MRDAMDPELSAALQRLEGKFDALDDKMDGFVREQAPKMAVIEHRVGVLESQRDRKWTVWLAVAALVVALLGSFLAPVIVR